MSDKSRNLWSPEDPITYVIAGRARGGQRAGELPRFDDGSPPLLNSRDEASIEPATVGKEFRG